jgi:uncharacterized protein YdeI (YjbR/CyaY-like superfamily)
MARDPRVDAYIAGAQPFARPILTHLRDVIHAACPDAVETIKWSRPFFEHKGRMFAALGAFKAHASLILWRMGESGGITSREREGMGDFGKITSLADLPADAEVIAAVRDAMDAIDTGKPARAKTAPRPELPVPDELAAALAEAPHAKAVFNGFSPSQRRDYNEWIGEAKRPETRAARVQQAIEWLFEGKARNWKYQK